MKHAGFAILALLGACTALVEPDRARLDTAAPCDGDEECDDGLYCNGAETCIARVCVHGADEPCDEGIACTIDYCDESTHECDNQVRDERCAQDPVAQICDPVEGCVPK